MSTVYDRGSLYKPSNYVQFLNLVRHLILAFRISEPVTCSSLAFYHWATYPFLFFTCSVLPGPRVLHPGLQRGHHHRDPGHQARDAEVCTHTSGGLFPVKILFTCVVCDEFISICVATKNNFDLCGLGRICSFQCCHKIYFWVVWYWTDLFLSVWPQKDIFELLYGTDFLFLEFEM